MSVKTCPRCGAEGNEAGWCTVCQRRITHARSVRFEQRSTSPRPRRWKVKRRFLHWQAALMSLVIPGLGQIYKGRVAAGAAWLLIVVGCYVLVGYPALLVHLMCVVTAGSTAKVVRKPFLAMGDSWAEP
jgi:hypothetical protein